MAFRKIDVDAYDEDVLQESELYNPDPRQPAQVLSDAKQKQLAVRSALNKCVLSFLLSGFIHRITDRMRRGDIAGALGVVLDSPPYGPNVEEAKVCPVYVVRPCRSPSSHSQNLTLQIVVSVLNSTKATDVPAVLRSLSQDEQDTLMKYIYKGMGMPGWGDVSGSVLLGWHEKVRSSLWGRHVAQSKF